MKLKCVGKRIVSALLAFALTVSVMPAGQLVSFADVAVDEATTAENVSVVQQIAQTYKDENAMDLSNTLAYTWSGSTDRWTFYNGMMMDSYIALGNALNTEDYYAYAKAFYDNVVLNDDGTPLTAYQNASDISYVPTGLALFDLLNSEEEENDTTTSSDVDTSAVPFKFIDDNNDGVADLFDQSKKSTDFGLEEKANEKLNRVTVYDGGAEGTTEHFVNGVVMTSYQNKLYCQWQTSVANEDDADTTRVVYSVKEGDGPWSEPIELAPVQNDGSYYSSGGWYVNDNDTPDDTTDDKLVAYLNYWPISLIETGKPYKGGEVRYKELSDGIWSDIKQVTMFDGTPLRGIFEQDPHVLDSGRIVSAAHFQQISDNNTPSEIADDTTDGGLILSPVFTDDKSGTTGWFKSDFTVAKTAFYDDDDTLQSEELEPSMYVNEDGNLVMIFRSQVDSLYCVRAAISTDQGVTWSESKETNLPDVRQKQSAGNLPDGTAYIVNCPISEDNYTNEDGSTRKLRYPLTISLSADGKTFTDAYVIGPSDTAAVGSIVHTGSAKRLGYHYPKSVVIGDKLYVSYARNKEVVEYVELPLNDPEISIKSEGKITSSENSNIGVIKFDESVETNWELDYDLRSGTKIFVDRPNSGTYLTNQKNKFFAVDTQSGTIPETLVGAVYIRTANANKSESEDTLLAKIKADQKIHLYLGIQSSLAQPSWATDFKKVEGLTYQATSGTSGITYQFYMREVSSDKYVEFYGQNGGSWNYIAMAVPVAETTPDDKYETAINYIYNKLNGGNFTQLSNYGGNYSEDGANFTLSDVYMAQRFLVECANAVSVGSLTLKDSNSAEVTADSLYAQVYNSLYAVYEYLYDSETKLFKTGTSDSSNSAKEIGYYAMTLVDAISLFPEGTNKESLIDILKDLFDGMLKYQDAETGMWPSAITTGSDMNYEGSSMMSYALLKAYEEDILIDATYGKAGVMAFNGVVANKLTTTTLSADTTSDETNASGFAPLMMASVYAEGVSDYLENGTTSNYEDVDTGIIVSGVENAEISQLTEDELSALLNTLDIYLTNAEGYNITLDNYTNTGATVKIPTNSTAKDLSVYLIKEDGTYESISGTVDTDGNFVFTITEGGTYVLGSTVSWNELPWRYVGKTDEYEDVYEMIKDDATEYVITQPGTANSMKNTLAYENDTTQAAITSSLRTIEGKYTLSNITAQNTWKMDSNGRIYCEYNGTKYYLKESFASDIDYYDEYSVLYSDTTKQSKVRQAKVKGSLALFASGSANFIEDNSTSTNNQSENRNYNFTNVTDYTSLQSHNNLIISDTNIADAEWHDVTVVIKNDSVAYYLDNSLVNFTSISAGDAFNKGYGYSGSYNTAPIAENRYGVDMLDFVSDSNTELTIGGYPYIGYYNADYACATDSGVLVDDIKFYKTALTADEIIGTKEISESPIATYTFDEAEYTPVNATIDATNVLDRHLQFNGAQNGDVSTGNGYISISNPYIGYDLSEELTLNESGYPVRINGITISYSVCLGANENNAPLIVFNNDDRTVIHYEDAEKYDLCQQSDRKANKAGKDLVLTTNPNEALVWATRRALTGTEVTTVSGHTGEVLYLRAVLEENGRFQVTSEQTAVALWSKVLDDNNNAVQTNSGVQAALTGVLEYDEVVGSGLTLDDIKNKAQIYYRANEDATPVLVDWNDTNHVSIAWESENEFADTTSAGSYTMIVKYDGYEIGRISIDVSAIDWIPVSDGTSFIYKRVQTMDPNNKYGYVITSAHQSNDDRSHQDRAGQNGDYYSLAWNANDTLNSPIDSTSKTVTVTNSNGKNASETLWAYLTNVDQCNLWFIDSNNYIYSKSLENDVEYRYYLQTGSSQSIVKLIKSNDFSSYGKAWKVQGWTGSGATIPNAAEIYDTDVDLSAHKSNNIRYHHEKGYFVTNASANSDGLYIYERVPETNYYIALEGTKEYTEYVNVSTLTEAQVLANATIYKKDTTGTIQAINWSDEAVDYTWTSALNTASAGFYTLNVSYNGEPIGEITVNVVGENSRESLVGGGSTITTAKGSVPDFTNLKLNVTYTDGTTKEYTINNGLMVDSSVYDITVPNTYNNVPVKFNGQEVGYVTVVVSNNPYEGLTETPEDMYPTYPEAGSVDIMKTASEDGFDWYDTGVTKVELDVLGTSVKSGVDVVLITDVSNSMGRYEDSVYDTGRVGKKLYDAMQAASRFADILLTDNGTDASTNNSLSFVTFASFDEENIKLGENDHKHIDSVQTVFTNVQDKEKAKLAFNNTKFIAYGNNTDEFYAQYNNNSALQIGRENGVIEVGGGRGGTNYDYAFAQAQKAVEELHATYSNYEATGRKTIVLFMTDGAPTYYNNERVDGNTEDYLYGTTALYPSSSKYRDLIIGYGTENVDYTPMASAWLEHVSNPNVYAVELANMVDEIYSVGFDLNSDEGNHTAGWVRPNNTEEKVSDFETILGGLAGVDAYGQNKVKNVLLADNTEELIESYEEIAKSIAYSGTYASVTDVVKSDFTLAMGEHIRNLKGDELEVAPQIQIVKHELYTKANCGGNEALVGTRTGKKTVLETVTFTEGTVSAGTGENGTDEISIASAQSVALVDGVSVTKTNCYYEDDTKIEITGHYFVYTKDKATGVETFDWTIGTIDDSEISLSYYAYLKGTAEGTRPSGQYFTNESARLDYIDMNGYHAHLDYKSPVRSWGGALTIVEYYLVNEKGVPVDANGKEVSFAQRVKVDEAGESNRVINVPWNTSQDVSGSAHLPALGYTMYNQDASYNVSVDAQNVGKLIVSDNMIVGDSQDDISTYWSNDGGNTWSNVKQTADKANVGATRVAFGVYEVTQKRADPPMGIDRVVMDYGKAIQVNVLANNPVLEAGTTYEAEVVGFHRYEDNTDYIEFEQTVAGVSQFTADFGTFSLVEGSTSTVQYTLNKMLSDVERIYTVVKVTPVGSSVYYYMYQELDIIPATNMYYETDFVAYHDKLYETSYAKDVFATVQSTGTDWIKNKTSIDMTDGSTLSIAGFDSAYDVNQDYKQIGQDNAYGYDTTYLDDNALSDGSSYYVEGKGTANTTATFSFTGTGFDIISRTGEYQGMIRVQVYKATDLTKPVKTMAVLNKSESEWEIYQIPVISIDMNTVKDANGVPYGYGDYLVKIAVLDSYIYSGTEITHHAMNRGNEFYFDAVRIYNPIDVSGTDYVSYEVIDGKVNDAWNIDELKNIVNYTKDKVALSAYVEDGEAYPEITEVRDILLDSSNYDMDSTDNVDQTGVIFVDRYQGDDDDNSSLIGTYENIGPNNEVYLKPGQAIAFKLSIADYDKIASIQIGAKAVNSTDDLNGNYLLDAFIGTVEIENGEKKFSQKGYATTGWWRGSSNALYHEITPFNSDTWSNLFSLNGGSMYAYISNRSDSTAIMSITDIKVTYSSKPSENSVQMYANVDALAFANFIMIATPDYDIKSAEFSENKYNVFSNGTLITTTTQDVESIKITNRFGKEFAAKTTYEDLSDGTRVWSSTIMMDKIGTHTYTVTGYGADGTSGASVTTEIEVTIKEGGGWQNAKSIYKTLFNCRILSIERNRGNRLFK